MKTHFSHKNKSEKWLTKQQFIDQIEQTIKQVLYLSYPFRQLGRTITVKQVNFANFVTLNCRKVVNFYIDTNFAWFLIILSHSYLIWYLSANIKIKYLAEAYEPKSLHALIRWYSDDVIWLYCQYQHVETSSKQTH